MTESQSLPMNFGGISEENSPVRNSRLLVWPIAYEDTVSHSGGTGKGASTIID